MAPKVILQDGPGKIPLLLSPPLLGNRTACSWHDRPHGHWTEAPASTATTPAHHRIYSLRSFLLESQVKAEDGCFCWWSLDQGPTTLATMKIRQNAGGEKAEVDEGQIMKQLSYWLMCETHSARG